MKRIDAGLDEIIGDGKTHVLIRTKIERIEHKFKDVVEKGITCCYWTMARPPKLTLWFGTVYGVEGNKIMFTDGINIIGEGIILEVKSDEIIFTPLRRIKYPQPKTAPTRGFTYVHT